MPIWALIFLWGFAAWLAAEIRRWIVSGTAEVRGYTARRGEGPDYWVLTAFFLFGDFSFFAAAIVGTHRVLTHFGGTVH